MSRSLFRETSLEKLSSPEQLDELIKVTSSKAWIALIVFACILLCALAWGFLGSIPVKIEGHGILMNNGGVYSIRHNAAGQVVDIRYELGDVIEKGDIIATLELPEYADKIRSALDNVSDLESKGRVDSREYEAAKNKVLELREEMSQKSQIHSPIDGRILELNIEKGSIVQPGEVLLALEQYGETVRLEAVVFVPADQGELIIPGMEAQISPTIVNKEEYGFMHGKVISVSDYPASFQSMMKTLENEKLVSMLSGQSAMLMVKIDLIIDAKTESGYSWSSPEGPPISIHSGTIVQGAVVTHREKPLSKVIPLLQSEDH